MSYIILKEYRSKTDTAEMHDMIKFIDIVENEITAIMLCHEGNKECVELDRYIYLNTVDDETKDEFNNGSDQQRG